MQPGDAGPVAYCPIGQVTQPRPLAFVVRPGPQSVHALNRMRSLRQETNKQATQAHIHKVRIRSSHRRTKRHSARVR